MATIIIIWNFLTMLSIVAYGVTMIVSGEYSTKGVDAAILFRGCLALLGIGIAGMLIISVIAFII
ncbi:MAG: hypothetical protein H9W81_03280 [Enterococcus sp.]|nr:hypothetical protein [Enterococcus sp.]